MKNGLKKGIIPIIFCICFLFGCAKQYASLETKESGYVLHALFDTDKEQVLNAFEIEGSPLNKQSEDDMIGIPCQTYGDVVETKFGIDYDLTIGFAKEQNARDFVFAGYVECAVLDHWPNEKEQEALQKTVNDIIDIYGEPYNADNIYDLTAVFGDGRVINKYITWNSFVGFTLEYDKEEDVTRIYIKNYCSDFVEEHRTLFGPAE